MKILGIESSCDETAAAILEDGKIISNIISSQLIHKTFGGVVPELASRAHQKLVSQVVKQALDEAKITKEEIDAIAVTNRPGLVGALLVGVNFAKALSLGLEIPIVGVHHIEGHMHAYFIENPELKPPFLTLVVSGGHTQLVHFKDFGEYELVGQTVDDAAGEAFDKVAKMLGIEFPGGPNVDKKAKNGNPKAYRFPRPMIDSGNFNFSFSGMKTAVRVFLQSLSKIEIEENLEDIAASFQEAVADILVIKSIKAAKELKLNKIVVTGGVAANSRLRSLMFERASKNGIEAMFPKPVFCTDNAAMIAFCGWKLIQKGMKSDLKMTAHPSVSIAQ
ncbi:MAG: tRNA (adenosine(37)-N6)-threonylcarbamoyltransferase complex transferase subunit TsaD [Calditrichaeota bacterium]|nr:MAG: tRNA (adenosine(37)-N6)-threonylcarbamoyltransferase complex transferase subunit TsaD [Calditrichota bacterium]